MLKTHRMPKHKILMALYEGARVQGMGFLQYGPGAAQKALDNFHTR